MRQIVLCLLLVLAAACPAQAFTFAHAVGGTSPDGAYGTALDAAGNLYVAGNFKGLIDLDPGSGLNMHMAADSGLFVARYSASGALTWGRSVLPQPGMHVGCEDLAIDTAGNVYVAGGFNGSVDFDPGTGVHSVAALDVFNYPSPNNTFVLKLTSAGDFAWVSTFRGDANFGSCVAVSPSGSVHVAGLFNLDMDVDSGPGNVIVTALGAYFNSYLVTLDAAGGHLWHVAYNSPVGETIADLEVDAGGSVYVCGSFVGAVNFNPNSGATSVTATGFVDAYVARYGASGTLQWLRNYGVSAGNGNIAQGLFLEGTDVYVAGKFKGTVDFDHGAGTTNLASAGGEDGFVLKLTGAGGFQWVRGLHGSGNVQPAAICGDGTSIWVSGSFLGTADFDPGAGVAALDASIRNGFALALSPSGVYEWSTSFGTSATTTGTGGTFPATSVYGMAGNGGLVAVCGSFFSAGVFGTATFASAGLGDAFFAVLQSNTTPGALQISSPPPNAAVIQTPASATFQASGGSGTGYQWSLVSGALPPGITGLPASATPALTLSGVPTVLGGFTFRLRVQDDTGISAERTYTWSITTAAGNAPATGVPGTGCVVGRGAALPLLALLLPLLRRRKRTV